MTTIYTPLHNAANLLQYVIDTAPDYTGFIVLPLKKPFNAIEVQLQWEDNEIKYLPEVYTDLDVLLPCHSESTEHASFSFKGKA